MGLAKSPTLHSRSHGDGAKIIVLLVLACSLSPAALGPHTLADRLRRDGQVAAELVPLIFALKPGTDQALAYRMAWATARWSRNASEIHGYTVKPDLMVQLMWVESKFVPTARGRAGEKGMMQLLRNGTYDVEENIRRGTLHYGGCLASCGGDERKALSVYNAGRICQVGLRYAERVLSIAPSDGQQGEAVGEQLAGSRLSGEPPRRQDRQEKAGGASP